MAVRWGPSEANPYYLGGVALVSSDGLAWTSGDLAAPAEMAESVAFGHGTFVVVAHPLFDAEYHFLHPATPSIGPPATGTTEAPVRRPVRPKQLCRHRRGRRGHDMFILKSSDGASWTPETASVDGGLRGIAYGQDTFVAVGHGLSEGSVPVILTSTDGVRWTEKPPGSGSGLLGIAFGQDTFVAVGSNGTILQSDHVSARL